MTQAFSSAAYWQARYRAQGHSGPGSRGRLLAYKAALLNAFIADNGIASVFDLGCGDGELAARLDVASYTGTDIAPAALARAAIRLSGRPDMRLLAADDPAAASCTDPRADPASRADLALSLDVVFHLVEDDVFAAHVARLFAAARRFVVIYSSNAAQPAPAAHVRHRRFTDHVAATQPGWRLCAHLPNPYPYALGQESETSFADFFIYAPVTPGNGGAGAACVIRLPPA